MTEQELIEGILNHDRKAVQSLVDLHQKTVIKTAFYFVDNMHDAEDLSQEVFIEIIRSIGKYQGKASLKTWIYRITVNKSLDFIRKRKRIDFVHRLESLFSFRVDGDDSYIKEPGMTDDRVSDRETGLIIEKAVATLPENQRVAFVLNKYDELSYKAISEIMNISLSSVESLIHRAKMNLQKKLVTHFSEYSIRKD